MQALLSLDFERRRALPVPNSRKLEKRPPSLSALPQHSSVAPLPASGRVRPAASAIIGPPQARDGNGQHEAKFACALTRPS
jgi:hypothetical protein